ncbi:MAG: hypothetical protein AAFW89_14995 [Bacteroidota bacterium]
MALTSTRPLEPEIEVLVNEYVEHQLEARVQLLFEELLRIDLELKSYVAKCEKGKALLQLLR